MEETMFAFLGLSLVLLLSINQKRVTSHTQETIINVELELMANAEASKFIAYLGTRDFDARTADGTVTPSNPDVLQLTDPASFPTGQACHLGTSSCTTLEDFHHMQPDTVAFVVAYDDDGLPLSTLRFLVDAEVNYVDEDGVVVATPTWTKEVTLTVSGPVGYPDLLPAPIVLKRQFEPLWHP